MFDLFQMRFNIHVIWLCLLLLFFSTDALPPCSNSRECDEHSPETLNFCATRYSFCISVRNPHHKPLNVIHHSALPTVRLSTLRNIIIETNAYQLSLQEKLTVIEAATDILENVNVNHLLYLNIHKYNASDQLNNLRQRLIARHGMKRATTNLYFHRSMRRVFAGLNDRHTLYVPPPPLSNSIAFLGFYVRQFFSRGDTQHRRYAVTDVPKDTRFLFNLEKSPFREGVEIITYDGIPVDDAVMKLGRQGFGSNLAARIDGGVFLLSFRLLVLDSLPLKRSVKIGYRGKNGDSELIDLPWLFMSDPDGVLDMVFGPSSSLNLMRERMIKPSVKRQSVHRRSHKSPSDPTMSYRFLHKQKTKIPVSKAFQSLFDAEILQTKVGHVGRLILPSFNSQVTDELIIELKRVLRLMPKRGLILDARRNIGGQGDYARAISELISDKETEDLPETARATELMGDIFLFDGFLERNFPFIGDNDIRLRNSLSSALKVGEDFTGPFGNIFPKRKRLRRVYHGPVVSIVDGLTYSAGDVFASLQKDQNISLLVGTSDRTGAGGASTTAYSVLSFLSPQVLPPLPKGIEIVTAIRRYYRSGLQRGVLVESFGIKPDIRYYESYNDAVRHDRDLFDFLAETLASRGS